MLCPAESDFQVLIDALLIPGWSSGCCWVSLVAEQRVVCSGENTLLGHASSALILVLPFDWACCMWEPDWVPHPAHSEALKNRQDSETWWAVWCDMDTRTNWRDGKGKEPVKYPKCTFLLKDVLSSHNPSTGISGYSFKRRFLFFNRVYWVFEQSCRRWS